MIENSLRGMLAKAGKPLVLVSKLDSPEANTPQRFGFMKNQIQVPDDFDEMGKAEIATLFGLE